MRQIPLFRTEFAKFELKSARIPSKNTQLSGVLSVLDQNGRGYCYIRFSEHFVKRLSKAMPMGLSPDFPGKLRAVFMPSDGFWRVYCLYLHREHGILVFLYPKTPPWFGKIYREKPKPKPKKT